MKTLLIYATIEGQTGKIAEFVSDKIRQAGHEVEMIDANEPSEISFENVDAVIMAAPVHERRHPENFEALLTAHAGDLGRIKTLLISVSLNAAFPEGREEAGEYVVEMNMRTGLKPDVELLVAGAVRTDRYDYFAMQVLQHVVLRDRDYVPKPGGHEFTKWDALSKDIANFLK
jgi:menaquinone-dependent protoporphyrinogen oxidase